MNLKVLTIDGISLAYGEVDKSMGSLQTMEAHDGQSFFIKRALIIMETWQSIENITKVKNFTYHFVLMIVWKRKLNS